jgi:hypothetical protein
MSVDGLTGNYSSNATPRVLHIALTTWDQMNMSVIDGLTGSGSVVHADVEAAHRTILFYYFVPKPIQQLIYCAPLRLEKIKEIRSMSVGDYERM